mgnify:FL=1
MKQVKFFRACLLALVILAQGCRSVAELSSVTPNPKWSAAQVVKAHKQTQPEFKYLAARAQLVYKTETQEQKISVALRMKRGDTIWMKATVFGVTLAKAIITKDEVSYYEMLNKTYYQGPLNEISRWLGFSVTMEQLQNILLGQSVLNMGRNTPQHINSDSYILGPIDTGMGWNLTNSVRPDNFRLKNAELAATGIVPTTASLSYGSYNQVAQQYFPEQLNLSVNTPKSATQIKLSFKQFDLLERLNFGYSIPDGFKQIVP